MSVLGLVPISVRAAVSRRLLSKRLLLAESTMRSWFGFPGNSLRRALRKEGVHGVNVEHRGWRDSQRSNSRNEPAIEPRALASMLRYPVSIELEATFEEINELPKEVVQGCRARHAEQIEQHGLAVEQAFGAYAPKAVAIVQGYDPLNAVVRHCAIRRELPVIAFENTALNDRILWDDVSGITTNKNLSKNFYWRHRDTVDEEALSRHCERLIAETKNKKLAEHASPEKRFLPSADDRPNILFLGQVYTDSSILFGIGHWGSPVRLLRELAQLADQMDFNLWVKLHPKEIAGVTPVTNQPYRKLTYRKLMADPGFREVAAEGSRLLIDHENEFDTYDMMLKSDAVITVNSQAGLEAAIRGLPAILAGEAFYGGLGFTLDASDSGSLRLRLEQALRMSAAERGVRTTEARIFTSLYFERYCVEKSSEAVASLVARRCF